MGTGAIYSRVSEEQRHRHPYHSFRRRAIYSISLVAGVLFIGTLAFHFIEGYSYINAFYFVSMLATAQGPAATPATDIGKIVAAIIAFVSVGSVVGASIFLFGPFLGKLMKIGEEKLDDEEKAIEKDLKKK